MNLDEYYELAETLCEHAMGVNADYAAVDLIANHRVWLLRRDFAPFIQRGRHQSTGEPMAAIRWRAAQPNPSVGVRGIHHTIVAALGGVPRTHHATLVPQALDAIANEQAERGRTPILAIDEAHMLTPPQLEAVRMLTLCRGDGYAEVGAAAPGSPWWAREIPVGHSA